MKKVYYLGHCGNGRSAHYKLIELVKQKENKLIFHIKDYDWDLKKERTITLIGYRVKRLGIDKKYYDRIDFHSSKEQYKFSFIVEREIEDNATPEESFIEMY